MRRPTSPIIDVIRKNYGDDFAAQVLGGAHDLLHLLIERLEDDELYAACRTKSHRATRIEMAVREEVLIRIANSIAPGSVRGNYYQATVHGIVEKTESGYDKVQRSLVRLRRERRLPFSAITDNTRWQRKPITFDSLQEALDHTAQYYRRSVWSEVDAYVEVWLEKDALAGVLYPVTSEYDVPLMVARGYSSLTFLQSAAENIQVLGKPAYIYHLGDHDPSGVDAANTISRELRELAPDAEIHFERLAVTREQIGDWNLPSRPTKRSDSRSKKFGFAESVELDAVDPRQLRELVRRAIEQHIPANHLHHLQIQENSEKEILKVFGHRAMKSWRSKQ